MTLQEWENEQDRQLDARLTALFQSAPPPAPSAGFVAHTMKAVRQAPLPDGRHPLRRPWTVPAGWTALVMAAAAAIYGALNNQPGVAEMVASLATITIRAGMWLLQTVHTTSMMFEMLETIGRAIGRAVSTREAGAGLMVMALVAAASLSILNKLLFSEKESSAW
jgi:hypothetical protein